MAPWRKEAVASVVKKKHAVPCEVSFVEGLLE
eukprot:CAMPEP_0180417424 /NCGR_PEP_ID=MMETSP1036_2-20121128/1022_1 /TAXON_ID=632150 /ORGANISM="Azadinium spinosum, Strain 3D9" /LENGTH=31 /DNA_ID= /DNA_START= /DNA_END= /DNA_ORIENTATION=